MTTAEQDYETFTPAERVDWDEFQDRFKWPQGQHVGLIGPTGCGKTTLTNALIDRRKYSIFIGSKRVDDTQDELRKMGFISTSDPSDIHKEVSKKWYIKPAFSPKLDADELADANRKTIKDTLMHAYRVGGWSVFVDEGLYVSSFLGLKKEMVLLLTQGRSQGNSLVVGTQRPRNVPLEVYDQSSHLFFFKDPDMQNVQRIAEMAGVHRRHAARMVSSLQPHEFLYYHVPSGESLISKVEV